MYWTKTILAAVVFVISGLGGVVGAPYSSGPSIDLGPAATSGAVPR